MQHRYGRNTCSTYKRRNFRYRHHNYHRDRRPPVQIKCMICHKNDNKYKCPKCKNFRYCSIACFQTHKSQCMQYKIDCNQSQINHQTNTNGDQSKIFSETLKNNEQNSSKAQQKTFDSKNELISVRGYCVTENEFNLLANDEKVLQAMTDYNLRSIISMVDDSKQPQKLLELMMSRNPNFSQFVSHMLDVIGFHENVEEVKEQKQCESFLLAGGSSVDDNMEQKLISLLQSALKDE